MNGLAAGRRVSAAGTGAGAGKASCVETDMRVVKMQVIGVRSAETRNRFLFQLLAVCAAAMLLLFAFAGVCWAEETDSGNPQDQSAASLDGAELDNTVNPQLLPDSSFVYEVSLADLAEADTYYDQQTVQVQGEAVGDILHADVLGTTSWVTLCSDDGRALLTVYMDAESAQRIDTLGSYHAKGTKLQVRGTFNLVCSEHSGETDLHAWEVTVLEPGSATPDNLNFDMFLPGIFAVCLGGFLIILFFWLRERQR